MSDNLDKMMEAADKAARDLRLPSGALNYRVFDGLRQCSGCGASPAFPAHCSYEVAASCAPDPDPDPESGVMRQYECGSRLLRDGRTYALDRSTRCIDRSLSKMQQAIGRLEQKNGLEFG